MVEYLRSVDDRVQVGGRCGVAWKSGSSPEQLVEAFVFEGSPFEKNTYTNRSMWPDEELRGVEFEFEELDAKGEIHPREIELVFNGSIQSIQHVWDKLQEYFVKSDFSLPPLSEFEVSSAWITSKEEETGLIIDETKCEDRSFNGCKYETDEHRGTYSSYNGHVLLMFEDDLSLSDALNFVRSLLQEDRVLIGDRSELGDDPLFDESN